MAPFYYAERSMAMNLIRAKPQRRTLHIILKELFRKRGYVNESD